MEIFRVIKPGLFTTIQDTGRYGHLRYGVPISGAMDAFCVVATNLLVANDPNGACLEITLIGPELQALTNTQIAITGGTSSPRINGKNVPMWQTVKIEEGDTLSFGRFENGCRAYLSVRGGIKTPLVLGSRSTYVRGGFGGIDGRQLQSGDIIEGFGASPCEFTYLVPEKLVPKYTDHFDVHVVLGPQADIFTKDGIERFLSSLYTVTLDSDRMGYRLEGSLINWKTEAEIISDALLPGAIQVPKNGKPIILMRDAQTTGGYPKIVVATADDVSLLGQAKPNDTIRFHEVELQQAHKRAAEYRKLLNGLGELLIKKL